MARQNNDSLQTKNIFRLLIITMALLSIPLLAMVFNWPVTDPGSSSTERVNWDYFDFIMMGTLIFSIGLAYEFLKLKMNSSAQRVILAVVLLLVFCLTWTELAVGIFSTPFAGS